MRTRIRVGGNRGKQIAFELLGGHRNGEPLFGWTHRANPMTEIKRSGIELSMVE